VLGNVTLDLHSGLAWAGGGMLALRPQESLLLGLLSEEPGRVVHYRVLFEALYGPRTCPETARIRLKALVSDLRRRIGGDLREHLCTVPRFGLVLYTSSVRAGSSTTNVRVSCV
jgi:DNA-binding response OmpR family regulator